ncbi:helix-turn-helix domain-containing protein [Streptomyces sp. NPDC006435]|uniref:ArsR/SmtB family transcription factor n=1 Tax=Streptomyces sp. NPDC006435 TaxID=3154300 RepID=UPI0033A8CAB1
MLRFHFTSEDLTQVRLAPRPHPLWETYFSLLLLQSREGAVHFDPWRRSVRAALARANLTGAVRTLTELYPVDGYTPDFLVAGDEAVELEDGLDLLMSTPRRSLREQMELVAHVGGRTPDWFRHIADGDAVMMKRLGNLLRRYHDIAVAPYTEPVRRAFAVEHAQRAGTLLGGGVEGLVGSYPARLMEWRDDGTLHVPCSLEEPFEFDVGGRAMTLLPSFFSIHPTAGAAEDRPLTISYPVHRPLDWHVPPRQDAGTPGTHGRGAVTRLIGTARAAVLDALDRTMSTSQLAETLRLSLPTASRHTTALREAGLVTSRRHGRSVLHTRTPLGTALLEGLPPEVGAPRG